MNALQILKNSGELEEFSLIKLQKSLERSGLPPSIAKEVALKVKQKCCDHQSTKKLFQLAHRLIKKENKILASRYSMTKAITELGPDGYHFEKFICAIFNQEGYRASTNHILKGKCVKHEIDVKAQGKKTIFCECKFHNNSNTKNDIKTALYVQARAQDLKENINYDEFWLISNTKFSKDAISYSQCMGLKLLGPNAPTKQALSELAIKNKVFPISVLTSLKKNQTKVLLKKGCILVSDLTKNPDFLNLLELSSDQKEITITEAKRLLK